MTQVRMLEGVASSEGWAYKAGEVVEIPTALAAIWINSGRAELVKVAESAVLAKAETADLKKPEAKKR